ncbi:MAG: elongation factor G [Candidatus Coatesbacteria bacterium]|nr:elongation factor G [Candidatus Coatesbacteria bacterium]
MKVSDTIRNIVLIGHGGCGKTTLAEAMLYTSKVTSRLNRVDQGNSILDYDQEEIERKMTIGISAAYMNWQKHKINLIDTPGFVDFLSEVKFGLRVADAALVVIQGVSGVEVVTEKVWEFAEEEKIPRIIYVTREKREHAKFDQIITEAVNEWGNGVLPVHIPVDPGEGFSKIVDVLKRKAYECNEDGTVKEIPVPENLKEKVESSRKALLEKVAEGSEELMNKYFEEENLSDEDFFKGLKESISRQEIFPVLCGDGYSNFGTSLLLDFLVEFAPSPYRLPEIKGFSASSSENEVSVAVTDDGAFVGYVFKTISEKNIGKLALIKVLNGSIRIGQDFINKTKSNSERIGNITFPQGKDRKDTETANIGDIITVAKLKDVSTGDTLADKSVDINLPEIRILKPLVQIAIKPRSKEDEDKITEGIRRLQDEDPSFSFHLDVEVKQTLLTGIGDVHLDVILKRLKSRYGIEVDKETPKIAYRETITKVASAQGRHKKQTGGRGQFGDCWVELSPSKEKEYEFEDAIVGGVIPNQYIPAVDKGIKERMEMGIIAGYKVVGVHAKCFDGSYHPVDSSELAFKLAGSLAFKAAADKAGPILLEPIYNVEVKVPSEYMGDVMGDLNSRRGRISGMEDKGGLQIIRANVPLAEMQGYSSTLRSITQGRGMFTMDFNTYEPVPHEISEKIIAAANEEKKG